MTQSAGHREIRDYEAHTLGTTRVSLFGFDSAESPPYRQRSEFPVRPRWPALARPARSATAEQYPDALSLHRVRPIPEQCRSQSGPAVLAARPAAESS